MARRSMDLDALDPVQTRQEKVGNSTISVGRYTYGADQISVIQWGEGASLQIGSFCSIAAAVRVFLGGNHRMDWISTYPFGHAHPKVFGKAVPGHPVTKGHVVIGNDVWVGQSATIMSGITIGDGAVIAANAHVIQNVAPYELVGGNPAKHIRFRFPKEIRDLLLRLQWWDLELDAIRSIIGTLTASPTVDGLNALIRRFRA
jgi:acetyltransferase-like isoleucine patch superfamily enzyme